MRSTLKKEYNKLLSYTRYHLRGITDIDAEDVLLEVAFNVFSKIDFDYAVENMAAYLYRSIRNKITDILRKPKRTAILSSFVDASGTNILLDTTKNEDETIYDELVKKEQYEQLHRALRFLPSIYRNIILAIDFDGKSIKELSREWEIPIGTLLSRRHRALAKLQKML